VPPAVPEFWRDTIDELTRRIESFLLENGPWKFRQLGLSTFCKICLQSMAYSGE